MEEIKFSKQHTTIAIKWLVRVIAELAQIEQAEYLIDDLSIVLAVLRKAHDSAPFINYGGVNAATLETNK
ncbi:MAG: hypothetical protein GY832_25995 [Chloroflexi bacterium]|nr:hypothetical protein [Chloroflexota bacterium]